MKLLELYLDEIWHQLPPKNRDDILKEIRSTLLDMIEDRNPHPNESPDEETIRSVLREFGSPQKVAQQFGAKNYLIGPRLLPSYLQVIKIVLIVVAALNVLTLVIAIVNQPTLDAGIVDAIFKGFSGLFNSIFTAFGIVTLAFTLIERTTPEEWVIKIDAGWNPNDLYKREHQQRIKVADLAIEITLSMISLILLNFFLDKIGIYYLTGVGWASTPILNENFLRYLPWITTQILLSIALNLYLIRKGFWNKGAIIAKVLINTFEIAIIPAMITGPDFINIDPTAWQAVIPKWDISARALTDEMNTGIDIILVLAIFGLVVDSFKRIYDNFIKGTHPQIEIAAK